MALLVIIPLNAYFLQKLSAFRTINLKFTDSRVKLTNEIIQGITTAYAYLGITITRMLVVNRYQSY